MAYLLNKSGRTAGPQSQHEFQLTAIETGLLKAIACTLNGEANDKAQFANCPTQTNLTVTRAQSCVKLRINNVVDSIDSPSLRITPLFPGSYTQSEIAIGGIHADLADKAKRAALPPELFFSRFNCDSGGDSLITDRNGINLVVIMLPGTDLAGAEILGQTLRSCPVLHRVTRVTLMSLSSDRVDNDHEQMRLASKVVHTAGLPADAKKQYKTAHPTDCHAIVNQLSKHDIALCPTSGLAIDAVSCGCACIFMEYACKSVRTLLPANTTKSSARHLRTALKATACKQRKQLLHHQQALFAGHLITPWWHELANAVRTLCLGKRSLDAAVANLHSPYARERHERVRIISPVAGLSQNSVNRLADRSIDTRRKLLKLYHSPQQFFGDSQRPELQLIARFLKGIDQ